MPLQWAGVIVPSGSTYSDSFGSINQQGSRFATAGLLSGPIRYKEVTCPIGAVDKHTAMAPFHEVYPVPECYVQTLPFPLSSDAACSDTVYRQDFFRRDDKDTIRSARDAARNMEMTKKEARRTEIPLGKHGFDMLPSENWRSDKQANFVEHTVDIRGDRERAESLKVVTSGPTASAGAVTASHMTARPPHPPRSVSALA